MQRIAIYQNFWKLDESSRNHFIYGLIDVTKPKIVQTDATNGRQKSVAYFLIDNKVQSQASLPGDFFATLGYGPQSSVIKELIKGVDIGSPLANAERRGGKRESLCADKERITVHILSYNPALPHYRRDHAPNGRYLQSELTITDMVSDYNSKFTKISYSTYQRVVAELNIAFTKLGNEECENCTVLSMTHERDGHACCIPSCSASRG